MIQCTAPHFSIGRNDKDYHKSEVYENVFVKVNKLRQRFKTPKMKYVAPPKCYESSPYEMWVTINYAPYESTITLWFKKESDMIIARLMV